jgi:hypothetical protein
MTDTRALECDLIMKGGVTSGLVYPGAIARIARDYRICSIGGTSAGAIAAAATAAMEYGLRTGNNPDARVQLAEIPSELGTATSAGTALLQQLFAAEAGTRRLLDAALTAIARGWPAGVWRLGREAILAAAAAFAVIGWLAWPHGALFALAAASGVALPLLLAGLWFTLKRGANAIRDNGMGLATGMAASGAMIGRTPTPALTAWLHSRLQSLAGLPPDAPLTFGMLWTLDPQAQPGSLGKREIDLVLVTSDLSRMQSASFPFLPQNHRMFIDREEWRSLFPAAVLEAIEAKAWPTSAEKPTLPADLGYDEADLRAAAAALAPDHPGLMERLRLLPKARDLPIVVAARASMAFPGLFTPLPFWLLRWVGDDGSRRPVLSRVLLSDGGITSNFPIHLFDAAVPSRPTFALNLLYPGDEVGEERPSAGKGATEDARRAPEAVHMLAGTTAETGDPGFADLYMPTDNLGWVNFYKAQASGSGIAQIAGLLMRVVETARTWGDVSLYNQPGMRDRIVHIRLSGHEGGFNLDMPAPVITGLAAKGALAAEVLARRFDPVSPADPLSGGGPVLLGWHNHRFVRLRAWLSAQELYGHRLQDSWSRVNDPARPQSVPALADLLARARGTMPPGQGGTPIGYSQDLTRRQRVHMAAMVGNITGLVPATPKDSAIAGAPRPASVLRLRPAGADPLASKP